jgi:outer membrane protein TolC
MTGLIMISRTEIRWLLALIIVSSPVYAQSSGNGSGAPPPQAPRVLRLSLPDAVAIALSPEGNERVRLAEELLRQAHARSDETRAALLPNISASVGQENMTRNLEALGIRLNLPLPGFVFPTFVGPFNVFDARAGASLSALNLGSIRRYQASRSEVREAEAEKDGARDDVRAAVARAYLGALRAQAVLEAAQADVTLAEALLSLAQDQKAAGTATGIDVTRAAVQLADERQRLLVARNDLAAAHLQLLRSMHLDLTAPIELTGKLTYEPAPSVAPEQALKAALEARADWQAQQKRLEFASRLQSAARMDRLPSLTLFADYGSIGLSINNAVPTRTYGFTVQVPIFDGGRVDARRAQGDSQYRQEVIRSEDLRAQIELEIRLALNNLKSSADQVSTAREALGLAENEVAQAQRRFSAGVSAALEITDAQTRLERARENNIAALFGYNLARIDLAAATGAIGQEIR